MILGAGQNENIALDPLRDTSQRVFLQCGGRFKRILGAQRLLAVTDRPAKTG
jgi:hypothetical protein